MIAGVIVPEGAWHRLSRAFLGLKLRHKIRGEIKWRYFSPTNDDARNPMRKLDHAAKNVIRTDLLKLITSESSIKVVACVCSATASYEVPSIISQKDVYHGTFKPVTERFQYYLQDLSRAVGATQLGIIVADHRGRQDDQRLRAHHQKLLHSTGDYISKYDNLVEGLFLEPSNLSVGTQLADVVAGSIWRKSERDDGTWYDLIEPSIRRNKAGSVDGHGIVKFPRQGWR